MKRTPTTTTRTTSTTTISDSATGDNQTNNNSQNNNDSKSPAFHRHNQRTFIADKQQKQQQQHRKALIGGDTEAAQIASELLLNNNNNNNNYNNNNTHTPLNDLDLDHHDNDNGTTRLDHQQLLLNQNDTSTDDSHSNNLDRQNKQRLDIDNSCQRTTFFLSAGKMFSSNTNNNNNGASNGAGAAAAIASGGLGDVVSKKTSKKNNHNKEDKAAFISSRKLVDSDDIEASAAAAANNKSLCIEGDEADASHARPSFCYGKLKWITIALMCLIALLAVILFAILSFPALFVNDDQCFNQNAPFQQATSYQLFSTKTLYTTAYNYLSKSPLEPSSVPASLAATANNNPSITANSNNILNQNSLNYDKSSVYVPNVFSKQDSLESLNRRMTLQYGCKARQLYFVGRHAARLPSESQLERLIELMTAVQSRIDPTSFQVTSTPPPPSASALSSSQANNDGSDKQHVAAINHQQHPISNRSAEVVCFDPLVKFKQWSSFAGPEQGNLLTEMGAQETVAIAKRFKAIYPDLFDGSKTQISVHTTKELRTAQTAINFIRNLDNFKPEGCELDQYPSEMTNDTLRSQAIKTDRCYSQFLGRYSDKKLSFHDECESYVKSTTKFDRKLNLEHSSRTESIVNSVKLKLKLTKKDDKLSSEETKAIYDVCKYESALTGMTSIWCSLFTEKDLRFYEYLSDVDDFFNSAYGQGYMAGSSCPVTLDVMSSLFKHQTVKSTPHGAHFHFTHSAVIQKILAASVDLDRDPAYSSDVVLEHLSRGTAPKERQWQTSLFTPFSANIAFTLYECPNATLPSSESGANSGIPIEANEFSVSVDSFFKVVASLNEQPIELTGCHGYICDLNQFVSRTRIAHAANVKCDLQAICRDKIVSI